MTPPAGPLAGLRVLELGGIGPAPFAGMLLAEMGAEVLRIERPGAEQGLPSMLERGKASVVLNLTPPGGRRAALDLAARADVLIEGFRPGVAERLGLGPADCQERNPRLVYGRMTGWGQSGPWAQDAGHDICYIAATGALHAFGRAGQPPAVPLAVVGDLGGGALYLVTGVLAALLEARRSGRGQVVDAAIVDGTASLMAPFYGQLADGDWVDERGRNLVDTGRPWYDVYETADGKWMAVGAIEDKFYDELAGRLGLSVTAGQRDNPGCWPGLRAELHAAFRKRTQEQWVREFAGTNACVSPVVSMTEAPAHPHLAARQTFSQVNGVMQPGPAPRFSRTPSHIAHAPHSIGQDTRDAMRAWGVADVDDLLAAGVAVQIDPAEVPVRTPS
jgi:alpha-methylacyl-CoA racemase